MSTGPVPGPVSNLGLILGAGDSLAQGLGQRQQRQQQQADAQLAYDRQQEELNRPVNPFMAEYIQKIFAGADPYQVGQEARNDPRFAAMMGQQAGAQQPPQTTFSGGMPQVNPAAVASASGFGQPPAQQAPQQPSLGAPYQGGTPYASSQPGGQPMTQRDLQQMQNILPAAVAAQGRQQIAREGNDLKKQIAADNLMLQFEKLDAAKQRQIMDIMAGRERVEAQGETARDVANIRAGASRDVASTNASSRRDVAATGANARTSVAATKAAGKDENRAGMEKELANTMAQIKSWRSVSDFDRQPELQQSVLDAQVRANELRAALGRTVGSTQAAGLPTFPAAAPQAAQPSAAQPTGKIRVKLKDGRTGMIDAAKFNPSTMTKL